MEETIQIAVIDREDQKHDIIIPLDIDLNLMEVCKAEGLPVEGTCGGMALCSTCHCYIQSNHILRQASDAEEDMLDQAFDVLENSRLGCQIKISSELNGLVVKLAPESL